MALLLAAALALPACSSGDGGFLAALWRPLTGPRKLSGDSAFATTRRLRSKSVATPIDAALGLIGDGSQPRSGNARMGRPLAGDAQERLVRKLQRTRMTHDPKSHPRDLLTTRAAAIGVGAGALSETEELTGNCSWELSESRRSSLKSKLVLEQVERVPIRNQQQRGTCAAFTGVGALEMLALHPSATGSNPAMETIDLSEQRFYWMSRPDCQAMPCPAETAGSWYGTGFDAAIGALAVPLESRCPYNPEPYPTNETQTPQGDSCAAGDVGIGELGSWCGVEGLLDMLEAGYAVPFASSLSDNWERTDGMITAADDEAAGTTGHASGHAYLIVGYLAEPSLAGEGGLCLLIKNSWGTGWGSHGFGCMTLAWVQRHLRDHMSYQQPIPTRILLSEELAARGRWSEPVDAGDTDDNADAVEEDEADAGRDNGEGELEPVEPKPDLDPDAGEDRGQRRDDPRRRSDLTWTASELEGPAEGVFQVEVASAADELLVRAVQGDGSRTEPLRTIRSGDRLMYQGDEVGRVDGARLVLCTQDYAALCALRYRGTDQQLYLQFRDDDLRRVKPTEVESSRGSWQTLGAGLPEVFVPVDQNAAEFLMDPKLFVRPGVPGAEPTRVSMRPGAGVGVFDIKLQGIAVGGINLFAPSEAALCSGAYRYQCEVFVGERLLVLPGARRAR